MKHFLFFLTFSLVSIIAAAQSGEIKGTVKDATTSETIIGASIQYAPGKGTITDINGNYSIKLDSGDYNVTISFVGYEPQTSKVKVRNKTVTLDVVLQLKTMNEVEVVADVAKTRETPIAFANISAKQIEEELGSKDLPMILNSTPGVYATEGGGGSGDARINVRGFDQKNCAVMVDGVPVNDMEDNSVFWSNWDGLSGITETMQIQRGLGASKLSTPAVGGSINIITKGIDQKMGANIKQEVDNYGLYKTSFGYNSGQLKGNWGVAVAGSKKWGSEWADGTFVDEYSYFFKIQKRFNKHLLSFSVNGAPQKHGRRSTKLPIAIYNKELAEKLGINADSVYKVSAYTTATQGERGMHYNSDWGFLDGKEFSANRNFYHKPAFNLSHLWTINDKMTLSTVAYLSIGTGGGVVLKTPGVGRDTTDGTLLLEKTYHANFYTAPDTRYSTTEHAASNYLRSAQNNHHWYGIFSYLSYKINKNINALFGVDVRYYKGNHYQTIYDLMGGDYAVDASSDLNQPKPTYFGDPRFKDQMRRVGDKTVYNSDSKVTWGGLYAQAEYKKDKWSGFISATLSQKSYVRIDYYKRKDLVIDGNTFAQVIGYGDEFYYNGNSYLIARYGTSSTNGTSTVVTKGDTTFIGTGVNRKYILNAKKYTGDSDAARYATTAKRLFTGFTVKGGANYNINDHMNVFFNAGYLRLAPVFSAVFDNNNHEILNTDYQKVLSVEGGYGIIYSKTKVDVNLYYTDWKNVPYTSSYDSPDGPITFNINGLEEVHKGIEIVVTHKIIKKLEAKATASIGDWKNVSGAKAYVYDNNGVLQDSVDFSAKNVHVGNSAQIQYIVDLRYEPIKNLYIKPRFTYFGKNYSDFSAVTLIGNNKDRESWKLPNYYLFDVFLGYDYKVGKVKLTFTAGISNILNAVYISDAQNNGTIVHHFDANSATVYMGMGRRINGGMKLSF